MSRVREIDIKNRLYHFFDGIINFKNLDPNNININEKSYYENILIFFFGYVTPNSVKALCLNQRTKWIYLRQ